MRKNMNRNMRRSTKTNKAVVITNIDYHLNVTLNYPSVWLCR